MIKLCDQKYFCPDQIVLKVNSKVSVLRSWLEMSDRIENFHGSPTRWDDENKQFGSNTRLIGCIGIVIYSRLFSLVQGFYNFHIIIIVHTCFDHWCMYAYNTGWCFSLFDADSIVRQWKKLWTAFLEMILVILAMYMWYWTMRISVICASFVIDVLLNCVLFCNSTDTDILWYFFMLVEICHIFFFPWHENFISLPNAVERQMNRAACKLNSAHFV